MKRDANKTIEADETTSLMCKIPLFVFSVIEGKRC
jgi:hypothetical protein